VLKPVSCLLKKTEAINNKSVVWAYEKVGRKSNFNSYLDKRVCVVWICICMMTTFCINGVDSAVLQPESSAFIFQCTLLNKKVFEAAYTVQLSISLASLCFSVIKWLCFSHALQWLQCYLYTSNTGIYLLHELAQYSHIYLFTHVISQITLFIKTAY
jgi:hypothetical protein